MGLEGRSELLRHVAKQLDLNSDKIVPSASSIKNKQLIEQQMQMQAQQQMQQGMNQQQPEKPATKPNPSGQALMSEAPVTDTFSPTKM
jgi:hypothetical protein